MIRAENVCKYFYVPEKLEALKDVSLDVAPSEVVVVIGPSGSGKSTFLRCLNRLEYADEGSIFIEGTDILDPGCNINAIRAEVGMVFQGFNLFPHKTVLDNLTMAQQTVRKRSKKGCRGKRHGPAQKGRNF